MLLVAALCLPLTALIWQVGRVANLRVLLDYKREKAKTEYAATQKRWEDAVAAGRADALSVLARVDAMELDLKRHLEGRELVRKAG